MARDHDSLVAQIERDALDDSVPVATALRKCVALGGKSGSEPLRDWATRELQGYDGNDELPTYRIIAAPLRIDGLAGNYQVTGEQLAASAIPDFARDVISEKVHLREGVGAIEAMTKMAEIKLQPPGASDLARLMNAERQDPSRQIVALYWAISHATIEGVLDQIRTALTQLVAELRASMPGGEDVPSAEVANNAVSVIVSGRRARANVTVAQASASSGDVAAAGIAPESRFWTRWRKIGAFVVGAATIAGAVAAVVALTQ
jgi:hypothetical protein